VGGVSRFLTLLGRYAPADPCVIFSGDFLAPSLLSTETHGMHMVPFFNKMGIKASVLGNHDFDHGLEHTVAAMAASNFPFVLSNVEDLALGEQLAGARRTLVIEHAGVRIGLIGLIEEEWLATLASIDRSQLRYTDYVAVARELEPRLRSEKGCELVIALTHSRMPNDRRLAEQCPGLDLVLGGHDHDPFRERVNGVPIIKSGTDFRELSKVTITLGGDGGDGGDGTARVTEGATDADAPAGEEDATAPVGVGTRRARCTVEWEAVYVTSEVPEDPEAAAMVAECGRELTKTLEIVIGELGVALDFRFAQIRTQETNGSNFVVDLLRRAAPAAEVVLLNAGTLRAVRAVRVGGTARRRARA